MDYQFFPTPKALALQAWQMFESDAFQRVLEPSAGMGHLIAVRDELYPRDRIHVDACEIDVSKHPVLRDMSYVEVVGTDFLDFTEGAFYSHIIMNPPFAYGAEHVLHAWEILYSGEIVAILNAETVRNPFSRERQRLLKLIEDYGRTEFVGAAFDTSENPDVERQANVEVVLVHLKKPEPANDYSADIADRILDGLQRDGEDDRLNAARVDVGDSEVTLPAGFVEDAVLRFNTAVEAMKQAVLAQARARNYAMRLADRFEDKARYLFGDKATAATVRKDWFEGYSKLKSMAWRALLRTTQVQSKLSSEAQRRLEAEFERVASLSFTESNIYAFLQGLHESAWDIQLGMMCDVFDLVTKYASDNTVYYMGWKSNDKHVSQARRIKTTRFILPGFECPDWRSTMYYSDAQRLADIDKVFAMLDGKQQPPSGLMDAFCGNPQLFEVLKSGGRVSLSYFDVRYYKGIGTIHFFPTRKDLVDRLNRLVGQHRQWLPDEPSEVSDAFWKQYEDAEKFDRDLRKAFGALAVQECGSPWSTPSLNDLDRPYNEERVAKATDLMRKALEQTLAGRGIDTKTMLLPKRQSCAALPSPQACEGESAEVNDEQMSLI